MNGVIATIGSAPGQLPPVGTESAIQVLAEVIETIAGVGSVNSSEAYGEASLDILEADVSTDMIGPAGATAACLPNLLFGAAACTPSVPRPPAQCRINMNMRANWTYNDRFGPQNDIDENGTATATSTCKDTTIHVTIDITHRCSVENRTATDSNTGPSPLPGRAYQNVRNYYANGDFCGRGTTIVWRFIADFVRPSGVTYTLCASATSVVGRDVVYGKCS